MIKSKNAKWIEVAGLYASHIHKGKLKLRCLEEIQDDELVELAIVRGCDVKAIPEPELYELMNGARKNLLQLFREGFSLSYDMTGQEVAYISQYLISKGFGDIPLYCLNGLTAFESGIAKKPIKKK